MDTVTKNYVVSYNQLQKLGKQLQFSAEFPYHASVYLIQKKWKSLISACLNRLQDFFTYHKRSLYHWVTFKLTFSILSRVFWLIFKFYLYYRINFYTRITCISSFPNVLFNSAVYFEPSITYILLIEVLWITCKVQYFFSPLNNKFFKNSLGVFWQ